jgi:hypothetical protein
MIAPRTTHIATISNPRSNDCGADWPGVAGGGFDPAVARFGSVGGLSEPEAVLELVVDIASPEQEVETVSPFGQR